jgi:hypothetical protein
MRRSFAREAKVRAVGSRPGQAMIETMLAVIVVTFLFLTLFRLSHMLTGKILLEHAAMRAARARAVGFNDFMCRKAACVAVIPVAGRRLWPADGGFTDAMELSRAAIYMGTPNAAVARGVLEYEGWASFRVAAGRDGTAQTRLETDWFDLDGHAAVEENFTLYMNDQGL